MAEYQYRPTVGHWLVMEDDKVSTNWNTQSYDSAVRELQNKSMDAPNKRWRLVQVMAEAERQEPIIHTLASIKLDRVARAT